jgi:hypothetical protein
LFYSGSLSGCEDEKHRTVKSIFKTLIIASSLVYTFISYGQDSHTCRVLFLGNSVFYSRGGLYSSFEGFCCEAGLDYQAVSQWNAPPNPLGAEFLNYGRIPLNLPDVAADERIHEIIRSGNFNFVILEARRSGFLLPDDVEFPDRRGSEFIPYEQNFEALSMIHKSIVRSGAQTVLYMHPGLHTAPDIKHAIAQIYQRAHADLEKTIIDGQQHEVILVPALFLWLDAVNRYGIDGWYADKGHGNALARYSSACMLFTYLTGKDPRKNEFNRLTELTTGWEIIPENTGMTVADEDAIWIKEQVWLYYTTRPR